MSTKLTTKSTIKLANAGHSEKQAFDVGAVLGLTGSQTTNGVKYSFEAEENTVTGKGVAVQGLLGPYVALEKSTGVLRSALHHTWHACIYSGLGVLQGCEATGC